MLSWATQAIRTPRFEQGIHEGVSRILESPIRVVAVAATLQDVAIGGTRGRRWHNRAVDAPVMDAAAAHCRNCGAATLGAYCHACGQSTRERVPTVREFVHEFIGHYVALEGPLWRTLALLLFRPGELTRHYLGGKRASYVLPLRLYLTFSVILVALTAWNGTELRLGSESLRFDEKSLTYNVARNHVRTGSESAFVRRLSELAALAPEERTKRLRSSVQATLPYVLVALVFLLALALKLAYWNRG